MDKKQFETYTSNKPYLSEYFSALGLDKKGRYTPYVAYIAARKETCKTLYAQKQKKQLHSQKITLKGNQASSIFWGLVIAANVAILLTGKSENLTLTTLSIAGSALMLADQTHKALTKKKALQSNVSDYDNYIERKTWDTIVEKARDYEQAMASNPKAQAKHFING